MNALDDYKFAIGSKLAQNGEYVYLMNILDMDSWVTDPKQAGEFGLVDLSMLVANASSKIYEKFFFLPHDLVLDESWTMSDVALLNKVNINKIREVIYNNIIRKLIHGEEKFTIINGGEFTYNEGDQLYSVTVNTPEDNVTLSEEIKDDPECTKSLLQIRIVDALIEGDDWELFLHDSRITMHYIQWVLPTILH